GIRDDQPNNPIYFSNLGTTFLTRFRQHGESEDIEQAILYQELAVLLTPDRHPDMPCRLANLGDSFSARFERQGEMGDVEAAILNHERAIQLTSEGHPDKPRRFFQLGNSLLKRFEWLGEIGDIERAILNHERAVQLTPDGHADKPGYFSNLGSSFLKRLKRLGDTEQAILNQEHAIKLVPDGHNKKHRQVNHLGNSATAQSKGHGDMEDIKRAILNHELAIQLTPDGHHDKAGHFCRLGSSLSARFERSGELGDIEQAILNHSHAIQLTPDGHQEKPGYYSHLGSAFLKRFMRLGYLADVDQAILNQECAVQLTLDGHSKKPQRLNHLGDSFSARFLRTGQYQDLVKSIVAYRTSAYLPDGPAFTRFQAAKKWMWLAREELRRFRPSGQSTLDARRAAPDLLPRVAWAGPSIDSRQRELLAASSLACNAAAAAISENDPRQALEWLEEGRCIVWGQMLQLRTPVDELRLDQPNLAAELNQIAEQLQRGTSGNHFSVGQGDGSHDGALKMHRQLALDWDRIVEQVRQKVGFERFLLPKEFSELRHAARHGPVVVLNVSKYGCDALIIECLSEDLHHVHLEDFSYEIAQTLRRQLHNILSRQRLRDDDKDDDDEFRYILAELWTSVVKPILECLESLQVFVGEYLHIRWCPTGPLAFLPIHAAGLYNADGTSSISLPDIAISSYTPTLTALLRSSQHATPDRPMLNLLAVIQPNTPGGDSLPGALEELNSICKHGSNLSLQILLGQSATTSKVLSSMEECLWVHFSCHGMHDTARQMESGLVLHDGRLDLSKIIQKRLPHAEFAFLSACETAMGDDSRPEEAIHLAAGMLLAGYRGVVATMWFIRDNYASLVADNVYARLLGDGQPNGAKAAEALHLAMRQLREQRGGRNFSSWVPFIHMGL
ncbi:TPR-like protein, partial [Rickenella mellea]